MHMRQLAPDECFCKSLRLELPILRHHTCRSMCYLQGKLLLMMWGVEFDDLKSWCRWSSLALPRLLSHVRHVQYHNNCTCKHMHARDL